MIDCWVKAMMATPPQICGRRLLPFSIGHYLLLRETQSDILSRKDVKKGDLLAALYICSKSYQDCHRILILQNPTIIEKIEWLWMRLVYGRKSLRIAFESFHVYLEDFLDFPRHDGKKNSGKPIKSDICFYMIAYLMSKFSMTFDQAINEPLNRVRCLMSAFAEMEGDESLLDSEETMAMKYMDKGVELDKQGKKEEAEFMYQKAAKIYEQRRRGAA